MFLLKACPRCRRGDLIIGREEEGAIVTCLQCGYSADFRAEQPELPSTARFFSPLNDRVEAAPA